MSQDAKKDEFRKYLEKAGVLELLTKSLVQLYEEPEKPSDALSYLKNSVGGSADDKVSIEKLKSENAELKVRLEELEASQAALQDKISQLELSVVAKPNESTEPAAAAVEEIEALEADADAAPSSQSGETTFAEP